MMDLHCHIDLFKDPEAVISRSEKAGVYVLSVTTTPKAFPQTKRFAKNSRRIQTALGLHPQLAHDRFNELPLFDLMVDETPYVGEIGLDGSTQYREHLPVQKRVFRHILNTCEGSGGRILTIHSRGAATLVLDDIEKYASRSLPILHWFTGSDLELVRAINAGCWFSVGPAMSKTKSGLKRISNIPKDRILLESDGPFTKFEGRPMEPIHTHEAILDIARIWNCSPFDVEKQLRLNLRCIGEEARKLCANRSSFRANVSNNTVTNLVRT